MCNALSSPLVYFHFYSNCTWQDSKPQRVSGGCSWLARQCYFVALVLVNAVVVVLVGFREERKNFARFMTTSWVMSYKELFYLINFADNFPSLSHKIWSQISPLKLGTSVTKKQSRLKERERERERKTEWLTRWMNDVVVRCCHFCWP